MSNETEIYGLQREAWFYISGFLAGAGRWDLIQNFKKYSISTLNNSPPTDDAGGERESSLADSHVEKETGF
jgi:hypothetical protein